MENPKNNPEKTEWQRVKEIGNPFGIAGHLISVVRDRIARVTRADYGLQDDPDYRVYLPFTVRDAFRSGTTNLIQPEIQSVIRSPHWQDEGMYLVFKGLDSQPAIQEECLRESLNALRGDKEDAAMRDMLLRYCSQIQSPVIGTKLAQISRHGPHAWQRRCKMLAEEIKQDGAVPCLIAYSMLTGLRSFVDTAENGDKLLIAIRHRLEQDRDHSLYVATMHEDSCDLEEWTHYGNHADIPSIHLVDDTVKTGETLAAVRKCINDKYGDFFPTIEEKDYYMVVGSPQGTSTTIASPQSPPSA